MEEKGIPRQIEDIITDVTLLKDGSQVYEDIKTKKHYADVRAFGARGDGATDDTVAIQEAINVIAGMGGGTLLFPDGDYKIISTIYGKSKVSLMGINPSLSIINIGTAYIDAFKATGKTNITISNIKWNGSGSIANTERLIFFDTCTDVKVKDCEMTNTIVGVQFQTCTRGKVHHNKFYNILRKSDYSQGYGVLCNIDNDDVQVFHNSFNDVERHCVYFSSGSSNCIAESNIAINSKGTPFQGNCTSAQNIMRNIIFRGNIVNGIQTAGGGSDDIFGVTATGNIDGLIIAHNQIYDNDVGGGILVQHDATAANTMKNVIIDGNIINTIDGGSAIRVLNGENIQIINNQAKSIDVAGGVHSGIYVVVSGTDVGSFLKNVIIENNIMDSGKYSLLVSGADATHKATNIIIGDNRLTNATTSTYQMSDIDYVEYKTKWEMFRPGFYVNDVAAGQTDTIMTAGNGSGYNAFTVPFSGWLYSVFGRNGTITQGSITLELRQNGTNRTEGVTIVADDFYEKKVFGLGVRAITEGDVINMIYTTSADFLPSGTREVIGGFEIIRDINI